MDPLTDEQIEANQRALVEQLRLAIAASSSEKMTCVQCKKQQAIWLLYRCFECGCWFCTSCAGPHFGMERPISRRKLAPGG